MTKEERPLTEEQLWYVKLVIGLLLGYIAVILTLSIGVIVCPFVLLGLKPQELLMELWWVVLITLILVCISVIVICAKKKLF